MCMSAHVFVMSAHVFVMSAHVFVMSAHVFVKGRQDTRYMSRHISICTENLVLGADVYVVVGADVCMHTT